MVSDEDDYLGGLELRIWEGEGRKEGMEIGGEVGWVG